MSQLTLAPHAGVRIVLVWTFKCGRDRAGNENLGLQQLVLVNQCEPSQLRLKMAVHAVDILESAQRVATPQALQGCTRALATACS